MSINRFLFILFCISGDAGSLLSNQVSSSDLFLPWTPYVNVKTRPGSTSHRSSIQSMLSSPAASQTGTRRNPFRDENDLHPSSYTVVYDSSKQMPSSTAIPIRRRTAASEESTHKISSISGSGNESDYDNNQLPYDFSKTAKRLPSPDRLICPPVNDFDQTNELTRMDDLQLGDQIEITLHNDSNLTLTHLSNEDNDREVYEYASNLNDAPHYDQYKHSSSACSMNNPLSDSSRRILSASKSLQGSSNHRSNLSNSNRPTINNKTLDDSAPPLYITPRKDQLAAKRLLEIQSQLLLNTTLDAT